MCAGLLWRFPGVGLINSCISLLIILLALGSDSLLNGDSGSTGNNIRSLRLFLNFEQINVEGIAYGG